MELKEEYDTFLGKRFRYLHSQAGGQKGILLMHGYSFYAEIWQECGLVDALERAGLYVVSLDVPGYPRSRSNFRLNQDEFETFLDTIIDSLFTAKPVLLGSSASGYLALRYSSLSSRIRAVIAIAPVNVEDIDLTGVSVPVLTIWGTDDNVSSPRRAELIRKVKGSNVELIEGAGHACYLDKPDEFNAIIARFLKGI